MRILVEARAELSPEAQPRELETLAKKLKDHIGISADVRIVPCGSLARSAGKAKHVRDLR
jgi:phenylacetate-CoA ligase